MALLHMDGFDLYTAIADLYSMTYSGISATFSTSAGRYGGGAPSFDTARVIVKGGAFPLELWSGFAFKSSSAANSDCTLISFSSDAGIEGTFSLNPSNGQAHTWRGDQGTILSSATIANICDGNWHWLDFHYKYHASAGVMEMWVDGTRVMNTTGANTANNSSKTSLVSVNIGSQARPAVIMTVDDWVIVDTTGSINNGRIGDCRIETLLPTSDATPNNGTPSTGVDHYALVNEARFNTSNFLTMTNTSGQEELYGCGSLVGVPASINAVQALAVAENDSAGSGNLQNLIVSGGTTGTGASQALGTSYKRIVDIFETDPHTSAAWTTSAVNSAQLGFKVP